MRAFGIRRFGRTGMDVGPGITGESSSELCGDGGSSFPVTDTAVSGRSRSTTSPIVQSSAVVPGRTSSITAQVPAVTVIDCDSQAMTCG